MEKTIEKTMEKVTKLLNKDTVCVSIGGKFTYDEKRNRIRFTYKGKNASIGVRELGENSGRYYVKPTNFYIEERLYSFEPTERIAQKFINAFHSKVILFHTEKTFKIVYTNNGNEMETEIKATSTMDAIRYFSLDHNRNEVMNMELISITEI